MKFLCLYPSMIRGEVVPAGKTVELSESEAAMDVVKAAFRPVDGPAPAAPEPAPDKKILVAGLTREEAIAKLRSVGQPIPGNIGDERLAVRFNETFSTVSEV